MKLGDLWYEIAVKGMDKFKDDVDESEKQTEKSSNKMVDAFKKVGAAVATYLSAQQIINFGKACVDAAATVSAEMSAFEQIMGDYSDTAQTKMNEVADATGVVASRLTPYMTSLTAKFKGLGYDIEDATSLATSGLTLASDAAAFWDKSLEDSMGALNSFINGSYEGGEAIGLFANDTQMAAYAVEQGIVSETKAWSALDEATKQATRLEYAQAMFAMSGATGQAAKEAGAYANVQANLTEKWRQFKAQIGEPILQNLVLPAMEKLSVVVDKASVAFQKATKWIEEHKTTIEVLTAVVIGVTTAVGAFLVVMNFGKIMTAATSALTKVKAAVIGMNAALAANPIGIVVGLITGLVAAVIYLWNNCEWFRNNVTALFNWLKTTVSNVLTSVYKTISSKLTAAKNYIFNTFTNIYTVVSNKMQTFKTMITNAWNTVYNSIKDKVMAAYTYVRDKFQAIKDAVTNKVNQVKEFVANGFNSIKENISNKLTSAKETVVNIFSTIYNSIRDKIAAARDFVREAIDKIKSFFKFEWSLPKLKLPHISITGSFSLMPPSVPKFGIEWYKQGGILTDPTIFGFNPASGKVMAGGEAGPEAVAPISDLMDYVRVAVAEGNNNSSLVEILKAIFELISDDDRLKNIFIEALNELSIEMKLDNREVGRIVKKYA